MNNEYYIQQILNHSSILESDYHGDGWFQRFDVHFFHICNPRSAWRALTDSGLSRGHINLIDAEYSECKGCKAAFPKRLQVIMKLKSLNV